VLEYIEDKDVFQMFYTMELSDRLLDGVCTSDESEASMISRLREVCGLGYANQLQQMFMGSCTLFRIGSLLTVMVTTLTRCEHKQRSHRLLQSRHGTNIQRYGYFIQDHGSGFQRLASQPPRP